MNMCYILSYSKGQAAEMLQCVLFALGPSYTVVLVGGHQQLVSKFFSNISPIIIKSYFI